MRLRKIVEMKSFSHQVKMVSGTEPRQGKLVSPSNEMPHGCEWWLLSFLSPLLTSCRGPFIASDPCSELVTQRAHVVQCYLAGLRFCAFGTEQIPTMSKQ